MKKIITLALAVLMLTGCVSMFASCGDSDTIYVQTNAYFAPFEYYDKDGKIAGVDVEIMNLVGKKLGKKIEFKSVDFAVIIDNVSEGKVCDVGAAGLTITDERKEKVDFSKPYYTSVQYVIFKSDDSSIATKTANDKEYIVWEALAGKKIGVQTDTTGFIYADGEIAKGALKGKGCELQNFDNAQLAADAVKSGKMDVVIIDELPAKYITEKNSGFECLPLYYSATKAGEADAPVEEQYAICVTKGNKELLDAINEVLTDLLKKDKNGQTEIDKMVMKHMGF